MARRFDSSIGDWVDDSLVWDPIAMRMVPPEQAAALAAVPEHLRGLLNNREGGVMDVVSEAQLRAAGINPNLRIYGGNGQVAPMGVDETDPNWGKLYDTKFGGYSGGLFGALGKIGDVGMKLADNTIGKVAENTIGKVGDALDPVMDDIGDFVEPVVGRGENWFALTAAALGGAGLGALNSGTTMGSGLATGATDAAGGAMMPGAASAGGLGSAAAGGTAAGGTSGAAGSGTGAFTGGLNPAVTGTPGLSAGVQTGVGLNPVTGGAAFNSALSPGLAEALGPASTLGTTAGSSFASGLGSLGSTSGLSGLGGLLNQLTNGEVGGTPTQGAGTGGNGQYNLPWQFLLGAVLPRLIGAQGNKESWQQAWNDTLNADPWRAEQSKYMPLLLDTVQNGIGGTAYGDSIADSTARKMASMGYNMSGNQMHEIAKGLDAGTNARIQALSPLAMGRAPETRGLAQIASGMAQANDQQTGAIMGGLGSIFSGQPQNNNNFSLSNIFNGLGSIFGK